MKYSSMSEQERDRLASKVRKFVLKKGGEELSESRLGYTLRLPTEVGDLLLDVGRVTGAVYTRFEDPKKAHAIDHLSVNQHTGKMNFYFDQVTAEEAFRLVAYQISKFLPVTYSQGR